MMPAYRSEAEGEVRQAVVAHLRRIRPDARIMHEVNVSSFGNRVDVLAVSRAEIIAVEIKSAKDKLDRLAAQVEGMKRCAHGTVIALHDKFAPAGKLPEIGGKPWHWWSGPLPWLYPSAVDQWREPETALQRPLPPAALDMMWRNELLEMCGKYSVCVGKRPVMQTMLNALRWGLSGRDLTLGICAALRARNCIEADPAVEWSIAV